MTLTGEPLDVVDLRNGCVRAVRYDLTRGVGVPVGEKTATSAGAGGKYHVVKEGEMMQKKQ